MSEGEHNELQQPLNDGIPAACGTAAFETLFENAAGAATSKNEMLDEILRAPETFVLVRMPLTPLCGLISQNSAVGVKNLLQNRMHKRHAGG